MIVFDYIFYRLAKYFYKKDGSDAFTAVILVSLIELYLLAAIIAPIIYHFYTKEETASQAKLAGQLSAIPALLLLFLNYRRYKGKYTELKQQWIDKQTPLQRKALGILIGMAVFAPLIFIIIAAFTFGKITHIK
jgi:hypothetical protein